MLVDNEILVSALINNYLKPWQGYANRPWSQGLQVPKAS